MVGCATAPRRPVRESAAERVEQPAETATAGSAEADETTPVTEATDTKPPRKRHKPKLPVPRASSFGTSLEGSDPRLAAALLVGATFPSAASELRVAREYIRLHVLDSAFERLERAVAKDPRMAEAHEEIARIWRDWGLPGMGLGAAYRAVKYDPKSASARNTLGTLLERLGQLDGARSSFAEALALDPNAAWALNNLCSLDYRAAHLREAQHDCARALEIDPLLTAAHNNLALTYAALGDMDRARAEFAAAGDEAAADYNMGMLQLAEGNDASAALSFEQAIKARPFSAAKQRAHAARLRMLTGKPAPALETRKP